MEWSGERTMESNRRERTTTVHANQWISPLADPTPRGLRRRRLDGIMKSYAGQQLTAMARVRIG